ncbi:DUF917 family protein [Brevibacillus nitrificans]|uniref:S-methyl thiohydantoin desulfurase domain-containing protein n=1 Tax=Brevibacillus nitrificans TaxID=651560 RepID=UPI0037BF1C46
MGNGKAVSIISAIHLGIPLIDADPAGRAVPDLGKWFLPNKQRFSCRSAQACAGPFCITSWKIML